MIKFKFLVPCVLLCLACLPVTSQAKAHCFCKLGPSGSPYHDFGQIKTYGTQIGHDADCQSTCNNAVNSYLSNAASKAAVCAAANGASVVSYSAVGTRAYIAGNTKTCPSSAGGFPGSITFGAFPSSIRSITVNNVGINPNAPASQTIVPINTPFTTFIFTDMLQLHMQRWTYSATLYRDGVKIEQFSKKSPTAYQGGVNVQFTGQPNSFVHGHNWKIEWHYAGPNFQNGSTTFYIP